MKIILRAGDITTYPGDAIVNAANNRGLGGGGVDGAIHRAAGPGLLEACKALPVYENLKGVRLHNGVPANPVRVPNGSAVPTPAFDLPCRWVIHTAGPIWPSDPDQMVYTPTLGALTGTQMTMTVKGRRAIDIARQELRACYKRPLILSLGLGLRSIAFPAISAGVYGCPVETCAEIALKTFADHESFPIDEVVVYLFPAINLPVWQIVAANMGMDVEVDAFGED